MNVLSVLYGVAAYHFAPFSHFYPLTAIEQSVYEPKRCDGVSPMYTCW